MRAREIPRGCARGRHGAALELAGRVSVFILVVCALAVVGTAYWIAVAVGALQVVRKVPVLAAQSPPDPARWPRVSMLIPACNEGQDLLLEPVLCSASRCARR
jgi:hypothetical protein